MVRKTYQAPVVEIVRIKTQTQILMGSTDDQFAPGYNGDFFDDEESNEEEPLGRKSFSPWD